MSLNRGLGGRISGGMLFCIPFGKMKVHEPSQSNLPDSVRDTAPDVSSQDCVEIKICVRTYRMFYVPGKEGFLWKYRSKEEVERNTQRLKLRNSLQCKWIDDNVHKARK